MKIDGEYNKNGYRVVKNGFLFDLIPNGLLPYYTDKDGKIKCTLQMKLNVYYQNLIHEGSLDNEGNYVGPNADLVKIENGKLLINEESDLYQQLSETEPVYKDVKSLLEELKDEGAGEGSRYQLLLNSLKAAGIDVEKLPEDQQAIVVWLPQFEAPHGTGTQFKLDIKGLMASETAQFGKKKNLGISQIGHDFLPFTLTGDKEGNIDKYLRVRDSEGNVIKDQLSDNEDEGWFKGTTTLHFGDKFDYRITYKYQGVSNTSGAGGTDGTTASFGVKDYLPSYYNDEVFEKILEDIRKKNSGIKDEEKLKKLLNSGDFSPSLIAPVEIAGSQNEKFKVVYYNAAGNEVLIPSLAEFNAMGDKDKMDLLKKLKEVRSFEIKVKEGYTVSTSAGVDVRLQMQMPDTNIELNDGKGESQPSDGNASEGGNSEVGTSNAENPASPAKPETNPPFPEVTVEIYRQYWDEEKQAYEYELDENGERKVYMVVKLNAENGYELTIKNLPRRATETKNINNPDGSPSIQTLLYKYRYVVRELPVPGYVGTVLGTDQILDETRDATGLVRIIENKPEKPEKPEKPREPKEPPTPPTPGEPPKEPRKKAASAAEHLPKTASAAARAQEAKVQTEISLQPAEADAPQQAQNVAGIGLLLSSLSLAFGAFLLSRKNR